MEEGTPGSLFNKRGTFLSVGNLGKLRSRAGGKTPLHLPTERLGTAAGDCISVVRG